MHYTYIFSVTYLVENRKEVSTAYCSHLHVTQKLQKEKNMFVCKPVTIIKFNLCFNLRMLFFIKHLSKFSIMLVLAALHNYITIKICTWVYA